MSFVGTARGQGERIDRFEVVRYLASGGMGDVYVATDSASGEEVALKLLGMGSDVALVRFAREARLASSLSHPHIIRVLEHGRASDGTPFMAMELLEGEDLGSRLRARGVTPSEAVEIAKQVCDALALAHEHRIVHRDIKPENIFLCEGGAPHVKLLDFGLARLTEDAGSTTRTGMVLGTLHFMSPEQASGRRDLDARTDLWALGVVLFECLTGRLPFAGDSAPAILYQIMFEPAPNVADLRADLPPALVSIVQRALSKAREDRFPSAAAMKNALVSIDLDHAARAIRRGDAIATRSTVSPSSPTEVSGAEAERRLVSVVFVRDLREEAELTERARELGGTWVPLAGDDALAVFGAERWQGEEPVLAARFAASALALSRAIGVSTGRALLGARGVAGQVIDSAVALACEPECAVLDASTCAMVKDALILEPRGDGTARLRRGSHVRRPSMEDASYATPFVGRDAEAAILARAIDDAIDRREPASVVIVAPAGMGKSRLLVEALRSASARPEATLLFAQCESFLRDAPLSALRQALSGAASAPRLSHVLASADAVAALDHARALVEETVRTCAERGPVVLAIDDAQWLDPTSRAIVLGVAESAYDLPLVLWITGRAEARDAIRSLAPAASAIELKPLGRRDAERLLEALAGEARSETIERANGHPLFLEELGRVYAKNKDSGEHLAPESLLPPSIESLHLAQIDRLDPLDREYLKRAAIYGRSMRSEGVAALGADAGGLGRLKRAGILMQRPGANADEITFRSAVLQEVAYALFGDEERARLHKRAALFLETLDRVAPAELARHWDLGGESARAAQAYVLAAEEGARVGEAASTVQHASRALALSDDSSLRYRAMIARDDALQVAGDREAQRRGLAEIAHGLAGDDWEKRADHAWRSCWNLRLSARTGEAREMGERAIELAARAGDVRIEALTRCELALLSCDTGALPEARIHADRAAVLVSASDEPWLRARANGTLAYVALASGKPALAFERFELAAADYARAGDRRREAIAWMNAAVALYRLGRFVENRARLEHAREVSRTVGNLRGVAVATHNLGAADRVQGELDRAEASIREALASARRLQHTQLLFAAATELGYLALQRGGEIDVSIIAELEACSANASSGPSFAAMIARVRRASGIDAGSIAPLLSALAESEDDELRFEILAALVELDPSSERIERARELMARLVLVGELEEDRARLRSALETRFVLGPALRA